MHGVPVPHTLGWPPPPQVSGGVHVPQSIVPPHPSPAVPQSWPSWPQVFGTQPSGPPSPAPPDELLVDEDVEPTALDEELLADVVAPP
jgi:hypothetical protein